MENESFDWDKVVQEFHGTFEKTFATSKKAHFDCVPLPLRVVDGARSRWSSLILIDAVIYLLDYEEFNSTSRRAYNQQQVLYDCIVREMRRSCPSLYGRHLASRLESGTACHTNNTIKFVALKTPWCTAAQLKKHLLSDPTSKSREKFVGIIQSLFEHTAFANTDGSLASTFQKVVAKVAFEFKGTPQPVSGRSECLPNESSSVSSASCKRVLPARKRRASPVKHEMDSDSENEVDNGDDEEAVAFKTSLAERGDERARTEGSVVDHSPPRKLRYVTRSSTDGYRTGIATVNGTTYHCQYAVDKRTVQRMRPFLRVGMHLTQDTVVQPADPDAASVEPAHEYFFDPSLFDDQDHVPCESELDSWDFLDDWAWQQSAGPAVHLFTPLSAARPTHPLPLSGAGLTLSGQPIVHTSHSALSEFRSIAHPTVSVPDPAAPPVSFRSPSPTLSEGPCSPVTVDSVPRTGFHFSPFAQESDFARLTPGVSVPFPDPCTPSIYSRRVAFYRPVTPDGPFRQVGSNDELLASTVSAAGSEPAPAEPAVVLPSQSHCDFHEAFGNTARGDCSNAFVDPPCAVDHTLSHLEVTGSHDTLPERVSPIQSASQTVGVMPACDRVCNLVSATSSQDLQCLRGMGKLEVCEKDDCVGPHQFE